MSAKRRLPVMQTPPDSEDDPRPPWQWVGFGTATIFGAWLPLAYLAESIKKRIFLTRIGEVASAEDAAVAVRSLPDGVSLQLRIWAIALPLSAMVAGCVAGGFLVGRYGRPAGVREAALAGFSSAFIASVLSCSRFAWSWAPLLAFVVASAAAALGGVWGISRRRAGGLPV